MEGYSIVTIEGSSYAGYYYISDVFVKYLTDDLGNSSNNTIYLYKSIGNKSSDYIRIDSMGLPYYYRNKNYDYELVTGFTNISFNPKAYLLRDFDFISLFMYCVISFYCLVRVFK